MNNWDLALQLAELPNYPSESLVHFDPKTTLEALRTSADALQSSVTLEKLWAFNDAQHNADSLLVQMSDMRYFEPVEYENVRTTIMSISSTVCNLLWWMEVINAPKPEEKGGIEFRRWTICTRHFTLAA